MDFYYVYLLNFELLCYKKIGEYFISKIGKNLHIAKIYKLKKPKILIGSNIVNFRISWSLFDM